jgi:hypothetical protein
MKLACHYTIADTEQLEKIVDTLYCYLVLSLFFLKKSQTSFIRCM